MRLTWAPLLLLTLLLAACSAGPAGDPAASSATPTATETATPSPSPAGHSALPSALVTRVIDGDTIEVSIGGQTYTLRYIGIDTPETVDPRRPVECMGKEASQRNRELAEGQTITLEKDISETDRYGRLLRYVWLGDPSAGGRMVNSALVEEGFAEASAYPPDVKYADLFTSLELQAREAGRGLWGAACATPSSAPPANAPAGACEYSGTSQPVIKGNISSRGGEKIYHVPGGEFYDQTVINEGAGERWFCTEAEAVGAGWRASKR